MDIQVNIFHAASAAAIAYLLYNTDFIIQYLKLFGLSNRFLVFEYLKYSCSNQKEINYLSFLNVAKPNFLTHLIGCPFCLGFWMCATINVFNFSTFFCYFVYIILYKILNKI
jgi:hypothetical protein